MGILINAGIGILIAMSASGIVPVNANNGNAGIIHNVNSSSPAEAPDDADAIVDSFISRQAKKLGAEEYREAREVRRGDVNRDGKSDVVVLYTLEGFGGGNSYTQYLAVFLGKRNDFRFAANVMVGGKMIRNVSLKSVADGRIHFDTDEYRKNDPACCPSRKAKAVYMLSNGKLRSVK